MLAGQEIEVQAAQQLVDKNIGWFQGELPTTEGTTIYLPKVINRHPSKDRNFAFYKVISTHQTGHIEFGSFRFSFERPSTMFTDLRSQLNSANGSALEAVPSEIEEKPQAEKASSTNGAVEKEGQDEHASIPMSRFFDLFPDRKLGNDVFTIFESTRVDSKVMDAYRGLAVSFKSVQDDALSSRPDMTELPAREALVEFMIRISLGQSTDLVAPKRHMEVARKLRRLIRLMQREDALVEDAAEATIRACAWLTEVRNEELNEDEFEDLDDDEEEDEQEGDGEEEQDLQGLIQAFVESMQPGEGTGEDQESAEDSEDMEDGEDQDYSSPQEIDYRGEFKPELSQLLSQAQMQMMEGGEFADDDMGEMTPPHARAASGNDEELGRYRHPRWRRWRRDVTGTRRDARKPSQRDAASRPASAEPAVRPDAARRRGRWPSHADITRPARLRRMGLPSQRVSSAMVHGARKRDE